MTENQSNLTKWANRVLNRPSIKAQTRLRGNLLHILCAAPQCPDKQMIVAQFTQAIEHTNLESLLPPNSPKIYQIFLCGWQQGARKPEWTVRIWRSGHQTEGQKNWKGQRQYEVVAPINHGINSGIAHSPQPALLSHSVKNQSVSFAQKFDEIKSPHAQPKNLTPTHPSPIGKNETNLPSAQRGKGLDADSLHPLELLLRETFSDLPKPNHFPEPENFDLIPSVNQTKHSRQNETNNSLNISSHPAENNKENKLSLPVQTVANQRQIIHNNPDLIASYLSETLEVLGVSVRVSIFHRSSDQTNLDNSRSIAKLGSHSLANYQDLNKRLLVVCESAYSPDPSLVAEPIAQSLRELNLHGFRDARIVSLVQGEKKPEWMLRIDLTPPHLILKEWARWGEPEAIGLLLNQQLADLGSAVKAILKESTLHLFCHFVSTANTHELSSEFAPPSCDDQAPDKLKTMEAIALFLSTIAPQNIYAATVYGIAATTENLENTTPTWIDWLNLPAAEHPELAPSPQTLASQGHHAALLFILDRLLNPNLEKKLETGGIHIIILRKSDLIYIMTESITLPIQSEVVPPIIKCLRELKIFGVAGVRIYGRRSGEKQPQWKAGINLVKRTRQVTDTAPEFAPSKSDFSVVSQPQLALPEIALPNIVKLNYVEADEESLKYNYIQEEAPTEIMEAPKNNDKFWISWQQWLNRSTTIFYPQTEQIWNWQKASLVLAYSTLGCVLVWQIDRQLAMYLQLKNLPELSATATLKTPQVIVPKADNYATENNQAPYLDQKKDAVEEIPQEPSSIEPKSDVPQLNAPQPQPVSGNIFNHAQFTKIGKKSLTLANCPKPVTRENISADTPLGLVTHNNSAFLVASDSDSLPECAEVNSYPSLNLRSPQLEEQLQRYWQYLSVHKGPPDILILGSSRALRGVDPTALEASLASQGYPGLKVYNFGVNGATIQVVDFIVRRLLTPAQLPKLIILADGVRAFNSGRIDATYNTIANSEGYQKLANGGFLIQTENQLQKKPLKRASNWFDQITNNWQNLETVTTEKYATFEEHISQFSHAYNQRDRAKVLIGQISTNLAIKFFPQTGFPQTGEISQLTLPITAQSAANSENFAGQNEESLNGELSYQENGFLPLSLRFNPVTYYENHPRVPGNFDNDYATFQLSGKQTAAFHSLADYMRDLNINLVLVNMPLTQEYLDEFRLSYEQDFRKYMAKTGQERNLIFLDFGEIWPREHQNFSDPSHLNKYGAIGISEKLAQEVAIPWPKK